jgi:hypothetical protein
MITIMKEISIIKARIRLNTIPEKRPSTVPKPVLTAAPTSCNSIYSPIKAPNQGPINIPKGGKNIAPTKVPIKAPQTAFLLDHAYLAPNAVDR